MSCLIEHTTAGLYININLKNGAYGEVKIKFSPMVTSPLISLSTHTTAPAATLALQKHTDYFHILTYEAVEPSQLQHRHNKQDVTTSANMSVITVQATYK